MVLVSRLYVPQIVKVNRFERVVEWDFKRKLCGSIHVIFVQDYVKSGFLSFPSDKMMVVGFILWHVD